jgi:hypothetical protein
MPPKSNAQIIYSNIKYASICGDFNLKAIDLTAVKKDIKITNGQFSAKILF